ncbi:IS1595 family transposase [Candidatus Palauibacter sp.]|uniref:IS1595 family transposase n=1 Tax=Candidatus Palauibacter sp. TaxID=3101350 RepID=UPI003B52E729
MARLNLVSLIDRYNNDDKCRDLLERIRWPSGVCCLRCGDTDVWEIESRNQWECSSCEYHFSVTAGTIMHRSHLPLRKWFLAIYLMCESKKGMSAKQLERTLGVSYKTAWYLCHRIREAMGNDPLTGPTLVGVVEVDETMVGGKARGENWRDNKTWVAGAIQRGGRVRLERIPNVRKNTLHDFIARTVADDAEAIYTDELKSYIGIEDDDTRHETVNHAAEEWVVGDVHTNSVEGVWSLFKRSIVGTFHKMSIKHLDRYLEEMEWRFNNRNNPHIFRDTLARIMHTDPLMYRELTA